MSSSDTVHAGRHLDLRQAPDPAWARTSEAQWSQAGGSVHRARLGDVDLQVRYASAAHGRRDLDGPVVLAAMVDLRTGRRARLAWDADPGLLGTPHAARPAREVEALLSAEIAQHLRPLRPVADRRSPGAASARARAVPMPPKRGTSPPASLPLAVGHPALAGPGLRRVFDTAHTMAGDVTAGPLRGTSTQAQVRQSLACAALGVTVAAAQRLRAATRGSLGADAAAGLGEESLPAAIWSWWVASGARAQDVAAWHRWWARHPEPSPVSGGWTARRVHVLAAFTRQGWTPAQVTVLRALLGTVERDRAMGWWALSPALSPDWASLAPDLALAAARVEASPHEVRRNHDEAPVSVESLRALAALQGRHPVPEVLDVLSALGAAQGIACSGVR